MHLNLCPSHVTYAFQSECALYIWLSLKELFAQNKRDMWSLSDCNGTRTHNQLVRKGTLNHLVKLTKRLSWVLSIYLYGSVDCMFFPYHVSISEWIHTLYLPECQGTPSSKHTRYLNFKWLQWDLNPQTLCSWTNTQPSGQTDQMVGLSCEHFSVRCIWLYVLLMSSTYFKVNPRSIFAWMSRNSLLETGRISEV